MSVPYTNSICSLISSMIYPPGFFFKKNHPLLFIHFTFSENVCKYERVIQFVHAYLPAFPYFTSCVSFGFKLTSFVRVILAIWIRNRQRGSNIVKCNLSYPTQFSFPSAYYFLVFNFQALAEPLRRALFKQSKRVLELCLMPLSVLHNCVKHSHTHKSVTSKGGSLEGRLFCEK